MGNHKNDSSALYAMALRERETGERKAMQGFMSVVSALGIVLILLGLFGWTLFGLPALPVGVVMLIGGFVVAYLCDIHWRSL